MTSEAEKIAGEALQLSQHERAIVAEILLESLEDDDPVSLSEEWKVEIARRCREIDQGLAKLLPGDQVMQEIRDSLL